MLSTLPQVNGFETESTLNASSLQNYTTEERKSKENIYEPNIEPSKSLTLVYEKESTISESKPISYDTNVTKIVKNVGFANLPNQIHRKAVRRGFVFNLMITGSPGLGKSTFINSLFCSDLYNAQHPSPSKRSQNSGTCVESMMFSLREADVSLLLTLVDTPGFGQGLDNSLSWKPLVKTIESYYEDYLRMELSVLRKTIGSGASTLSGDKRIHLCLYFVSANGHGLHCLDIETLKQLHNKVNVVLVIGKADTLTPDECREFKQVLLDQLEEHHINLYDFPESVVQLEDPIQSVIPPDIRRARQRQPFAVVSSDRLVQLSDGRKVYGRAYPWGVVETDNLAHNDFSALKTLLLNVYLQDLIDVTHQKHYAAYFASRLTSIAETCKFSVNEDSREPLSQLETERVAHWLKFSQMENEMEMVFEQKVRERTAKLIESERDLLERAHQLKQHIATQTDEFEKYRQEFEDTRAMWELDNREYLATIQSSMEKADTKDKFRIKRKGLF